MADTNGGMNIYSRLAAVTSDLQTVAKNLNVETGRGKASYKAVSERDIIDAVKPLEGKYGIYSYPASREIIESTMLENESEYQGKISKKTTFFERIKTVYRFVNIDNPEEYIETTTFAEGIDSQDKGSGKAMTYGDKYALMKMYKISTGDDPDQESSGDASYSKAKTSPLICSDCGNVIADSKTRNGETWGAYDIMMYSKARFGRPLCTGCMKHESNRSAKS